VPSEPVIQLAGWNGHSSQRIDHILYGDGRLQRIDRTYGAADSAEVTVQLTDQEVGRLVEIAIRHGLVTTSQSGLSEAIRRSGQERIDQEMARTGSRLLRPIPPPPPDSSDHRLEIRLEECPGLDPVQNQLHLLALGVYAQRYPEISEIQGWLLISGEIGKLLQERQPERALAHHRELRIG
jgi:hypothetical protein